MNEMIRLPLGDWVSDGVDWVVANASAFSVCCAASSLVRTTA